MNSLASTEETLVMEHLVPRAAAFDLFQRTWPRLEEMLGRVAPLPPETPIPTLEWTIGDLAVHLAQVAEVAGGLQEGKPSPFTDIQRNAETNAELLRQRTDRYLPPLVEEFSAGMRRIEQRFAQMPDDVRVLFHAGMTLAPAQAMAMLSSELLVHGWDLAQVTGERWHIDAADARLIVYTATTVMPRLVDQDAARGVTATYEVRIRDGACLRLHFEDGELMISEVEPGGPADCRISADAAIFLLLGYGRGSLLRPVLTGKVLAWGRKPWLAARFPSLMKNP